MLDFIQKQMASNRLKQTNVIIKNNMYNPLTKSVWFLEDKEEYVTMHPP